MAGRDGNLDPGRNVGRSNDVCVHWHHTGVKPQRQMRRCPLERRYWGKSGSDIDIVKQARMTPTGRCAPQGGNCGILRQTRWDGSMKRRTLKWHLVLVLSVLVSSAGSTTTQNGLASPPLRRCSSAPTR